MGVAFLFWDGENVVKLDCNDAQIWECAKHY